jgi:uncharacterized protein
MSVTDELQKLSQLRESGVITDQEFASAKADLLKGLTDSSNMGLLPGISANQWGLFLHLSQFVGCVIPIAGFVAPILIWQLKKGDFPELDLHGKNVSNWLISLIVYACVCLVLSVVGIGILGLIALAVLAIVFPIIGAIKANNGEIWQYPLTIPFIK